MRGACWEEWYILRKFGSYRMLSFLYPRHDHMIKVGGKIGLGIKAGTCLSVFNMIVKVL